METFGSFSWVRNNWQCEEKSENWKYNSGDLVRLKADNTLPVTVISTLVFLLNKEGNFFDKIISLEWMCGKDFTKGKLEAATTSKIWYIFDQGKYFFYQKKVWEFWKVMSVAMWNFNLSWARSDHYLNSPVILRSILQTYDALSWLTVDAVNRDRRSCLPVHLYMLCQLHDTLSVLLENQSSQ